MDESAWIRLYWLPLGAGGSCVVRASGRIYERLAAQRAHRLPRDLYHSALEVGIDGSTWAIEMAPVWQGKDPDRGVVAGGAVGSRLLGLSRAFRYEVRCWPSGIIPDACYAVGGTVDVPTDAARTRRLLELVPFVPTPVWGCDELETGEMWNSNSVISWLLVGSGHDVAPLRPPGGGRAPGWDAGVRVAPMPSSPALAVLSM